MFLRDNKPKNALGACSWNLFGSECALQSTFWKQKRKQQLWSAVTTKTQNGTGIQSNSPTVANFHSAEIAFSEVYHYWGV